MSWTDDRVEILKKLWAEGLSASQVANQLGGCTRNAVISKVHRLGLPGRTTTSRAPRRRAPAKPKPPAPAPKPVVLKPIYDEEPEVDVERTPAPIEELVIAPPGRHTSIVTLTERMCRWPIGDPRDADFYFCARNSPLGMPYCDHHARIAYQPVQARRRDRSAVGR